MSDRKSLIKLNEFWINAQFMNDAGYKFFTQTDPSMISKLKEYAEPLLESAKALVDLVRGIKEPDQQESK